MKLRSCMALPVSCSGNSSATCEKVLSGAKCSARKAFALLFVLSLVFSLPVSAVELDEFSGVISIPSRSLGMRDNGLTENTQYGWSTIPVSFSFNEDGDYKLEWASATALNNIYSLVTEGGKTFEYILSFSDGSEPFVDVYFNQFRAYPNFFSRKSGFPAVFNFTGYWELYIDDSLVPYAVSPNYYNVVWPYVSLRETLSVESYIRIVYHSTEQVVKVVDLESTNTISQCLDILCTGLTVNNQPSQLDRIEVNIGNIEADIGDIKISIENIEEGVVNIEDTVTDMKEQLEDSSSPIWSAAGEKIADTVTGLFVPPQEELVAKKQELEQKLDDKLGSAGDLVDVGEEFVSGVMGGFGRDDIGNGYQFQFSGITFPMNGEEYVIIPAQTVKLNNRAFVIFQDALGFAVTAICFFSIIHICEDALYCLISGVSYWGFIRSRHDK